MNGRVPSLKDIRFQAAAARTALAIGTASVGPVAGVAALEFASHLNTPVADAAGNCRVQVAFHGFTYIDMYQVNGLGRPGKLDITEDPKIGPAVNFVGEVLDKKDGTVIGQASIIRRTLPKEIKDRLPQADKENPDLKEEGFGETPVITVPCTTDGQARVVVRSNQNPKDQEERVIKTGIKLHEMTGRKLEDKEDIAKAVSMLIDADSRKHQIVTWANSSAPTMTPQPTRTPEPTRIPMPSTATPTPESGAGQGSTEGFNWRNIPVLGGIGGFIVDNPLCTAALVAAGVALAAYRSRGPRHLIVRGRRII